MSRRSGSARFRGKNEGLKYDRLDQIFSKVHRRAKNALVYPLKMALTEWLQPLLESAATESYNEIRPRLNALLELDNTLGLYGRTSKLERIIQLKIPNPAGGCPFASDEYDESRPFAMPTLKLDIPHHETWGLRHHLKTFGQKFTDGIIISQPYIACSYNPDFNGLTMPEEVLEVWQYTFKQLETLFSELAHWYVQFSQRQPGNDRVNSISSTENYHRAAAAMQFSPVFAQWVQFIGETNKVWYVDDCPPPCKVLRRSSTFKYQKGMAHELHVALSTALHLAQAQLAAKKEEEEDA
jgi:hypothetical protein